MGTATGERNFFRSLGGGADGRRCSARSCSAASARRRGFFAGDLASGAVDRATMITLFQYVFAATCLGFALALAFLLMMKEMPLRGSAIAAAKEAAGD